MIEPRDLWGGLLLVLVTLGCDGAGSAEREGGDEVKTLAQAQEYAQGWAKMGMWLPNSKQVAFFAANLKVTQRVLEERLLDENEDIRQRAAYVIEEIGPAARPLQKALVAALTRERESLVRIYISNALRAIGGADDEVLAELRTLFKTPGDDKEAMQQRIYAAAALAALSQDPSEVSRSTAYVCEWLEPPRKDLQSAELEQYWDARWSAVNAIEHVPGAEQAVPLLEAMLKESGKPAWVNVHVPRALASLKKTPVAEPKRIVASVRWSPPANPDPQEILREAQADAIAGRYADALAKHVWFHENALAIRPSLYGVRLSFALGYWKQLTIVYPAAKDKLREIRDADEKRVLAGESGRESFHDFESINELLEEEDRTVQLFLALDQDQPNVAKKVFDVAQPALIRAKKFEVCGKYIDPEKDFASSAERYNAELELAEQPKFGDSMQDFAQKSFSNEVATLVALLVVGDRKGEAAEVAAKAKEVWKNDGFAAELDRALEGTVPEPWP